VRQSGVAANKHCQSKSGFIMERRELIGALSAIAMTGLAADALAADDHAHHHSNAKFAALIEAAGDCVAKGDACLAHCLVLLGMGDKSLADCAKSVNQLLPLCGALQRLSAQGSQYVVALAKVALESCTECEKVCRKHADKHAECKACMEACADCIKQCKAVIA
jgi:Cys-rich four helix bundle protein (predicted Tat secretion target)